MSKNKLTKSSSNIYTEEQVHKVCQMLANRIKYLGKWKTISSQYKINGSNKISFDTKKRAFGLIESGITSYDELLTMLELPDTARSREYLRGIRWRYKKAQGSSTIEHSDAGVNTTSSSK